MAAEWDATEHAPQPKQCGRCAGCGQIADDNDGTPWKYWLELPLQSAVAVQLGLVKPIPCPVCNGTGTEPEQKGK